MVPQNYGVLRAARSNSGNETRSDAVADHLHSATRVVVVANQATSVDPSAILIFRSGARGRHGAERDTESTHSTHLLCIPIHHPPSTVYRLPSTMRHSPFTVHHLSTAASCTISCCSHAMLSVSPGILLLQPSIHHPQHPHRPMVLWIRHS